MFLNMFSLSKCNEKNCSNKALSFRDQCYLHLEDKDGYLKEIHNYFEKETVLSDLELTGVSLRDMKLQSKEFH